MCSLEEDADMSTSRVWQWGNDEGMLDTEPTSFRVLKWNSHTTPMALLQPFALLKPNLSFYNTTPIGSPLSKTHQLTNFPFAFTMKTKILYKSFNPPVVQSGPPPQSPQAPPSLPVLPPQGSGLWRMLFTCHTHNFALNILLTTEHYGFLRARLVWVLCFYYFYDVGVNIHIPQRDCEVFHPRLRGLSALGWYVLELTSASLLPKGEPETQHEHNKYRLNKFTSKWIDEGSCFPLPTSHRHDGQCKVALLAQWGGQRNKLRGIEAGSGCPYTGGNI